MRRALEDVAHSATALGHAVRRELGSYARLAGGAKTDTEGRVGEQRSYRARERIGITRRAFPRDR